MLNRFALVAVVFAFLLPPLEAAEPPANRGPAKKPEVVFRPESGSKQQEFRVPEKAAARFAAIVGHAGQVSTLAPNAPRLAPEGQFLQGDTAYYFHAEFGLLHRNLPGNRIETWSNDTLKQLGKTMPSGGRWSRESFEKWILGLEKPEEGGAPKEK
jgi:hypothetical protein